MTESLVTKKSAKLGIAALALAVVLFVLSVTASVVFGTMAGPFADTSTGGVYYNTNLTSVEPEQVALSVATMVHLALGTLLGLTALVLGIVAVATKRGRGFGVGAIVFAVLTPGVSLVTFIVAMSLTAAR